MDPEPVPTEGEPAGAPGATLGVTPHPLWLGAILAFGGLLGALDGQWGLASLFLAFSGALFVGGAVAWWKRRSPVA